MAIPTSRTQELAEIRIDETLCSGCGLCVTKYSHAIQRTFASVDGI